VLDDAQILVNLDQILSAQSKFKENLRLLQQSIVGREEPWGTDQILRLKEVVHVTELSRSTIYKSISEGLFPTSINLGSRASKIEEWLTGIGKS